MFKCLVFFGAFLIVGCASTQYYDAVSNKGWNNGDLLTPNIEKNVKINSLNCCDNLYYIEPYMINNKKPYLIGTDVLFNSPGIQKIVYSVTPKSDIKNSFYIAFDFSAEQQEVFNLTSSSANEFILSTANGKNIKPTKFKKNQLYELYRSLKWTLLDEDSKYMEKNISEIIGDQSQYPKPTFTIKPNNVIESGEVVLGYDLDPEGVPVNIHVISSPSESLKLNSIYILSNWRFQKTVINGKKKERLNLIWKMEYVVETKINVKVI
jgi:hypothetical protein